MQNKPRGQAAAVETGTSRSSAKGFGPPFNLSFQLVMGALFGVIGIALAVPIAAAGKVLLDELYVKDVLGGATRQTELTPPSAAS